MKKSLAVAALSACLNTFADSFPLWPAPAPGALGTNDQDIPTLTVFLPTRADTNQPTSAMLVCPGGGYSHLATNHEGNFYARWLNEQGIAALVLKYRVGADGYRHPAMLQDAARALRTIRARADEWRVDTNRVGVIGSSAGGHLASTLLTHHDNGDEKSPDKIEQQSSRPDLAVLCYPVVTLTDPFAHKGSRNNLLGTNPPPELVVELSAETQIKKSAPPVFIWHTADDQTVPVENSLQLAGALRHAKVSVELHIYEHGKHGLGLGFHDQYEPEKLLPWTRECSAWLKTHGFVK